MEYILPILLSSILLNTVLKLSFWKWWQVALFSGIAALMLVFFSSYALGQSKTALQAWVQNRQVMQNIAVLVTLEAVLFFAYAFIRLRGRGDTGKNRLLRMSLEFYPGLLQFPVLFYLLAQLFFSFTGADFDLITGGFAAVTFILYPLLSFASEKLVSEEDLRLELLFIVNLFVCIIGLISTVNGETTYIPVSTPLDVKALLFSFLLFGGLCCIGFYCKKYRKIRIK